MVNTALKKKKVRAVKPRKALSLKITTTYQPEHTPSHLLTHSKGHQGGRAENQELFIHLHWVERFPLLTHSFCNISCASSTHAHACVWAVWPEPWGSFQVAECNHWLYNYTLGRAMNGPCIYRITVKSSRAKEACWWTKEWKRTCGELSRRALAGETTYKTTGASVQMLSCYGGRAKGILNII